MAMAGGVAKLVKRSWERLALRIRRYALQIRMKDSYIFAVTDYKSI